MTGIDAFLEHLRVERAMSVHTLDAYRRDLEALAGWARDSGLPGLRAQGLDPAQHEGVAQASLASSLPRQTTVMARSSSGRASSSLRIASRSIGESG